MPERPENPPTHDDPADEAPWAMQLVLRVERSATPSRAALCAAAGTAVVRLLSDERSGPDGPWGPAVTRWTDGSIRKLARRARGAAWRRVEALPGVTARAGLAEVRALVPGPVDAVPPEVSRLQLSGSEPVEIGPAVIEPRPGGPVVVSISPGPPLSLGKAAAATGHATQLARWAMSSERRTTWAASGFAVEVEHPPPDRWHARCAAGQVHVVDAGFTEVAPGSITAVARWA